MKTHYSLHIYIYHTTHTNKTKHIESKRHETRRNVRNEDTRKQPSLYIENDIGPTRHISDDHSITQLKHIHHNTYTHQGIYNTFPKPKQKKNQQPKGTGRNAHAERNMEHIVVASFSSSSLFCCCCLLFHCQLYT